MWSMGHWKGSCKEEPGMLPSCGAHHRSMPHHSCGITSVRFRAVATAIAARTCITRSQAVLCSNTQLGCAKADSAQLTTLRGSEHDRCTTSKINTPVSNTHRRVQWLALHKGSSGLPRLLCFKSSKLQESANHPSAFGG